MLKRPTQMLQYTGLIAVVLLAACSTPAPVPTAAPAVQATQSPPTITPATAPQTPTVAATVAATVAPTEAPTNVPAAQAAEQELAMPPSVRNAYAYGSRSPDGKPGAKYWQNKAVHSMAITVTPPNRTVQATQEITYTNNSPMPLAFIPFRLYQNVHLPEAQREIPVTPDFFTEGTKIDEFRINGQVTEWKSLLPPAFNTVQVIALPQPLAPGASATFSFAWHFDLPLQAIKEGVIDPTTFYLAYFFPRIVPHNDTDTFVLPNWDVEEFTYGREFYNDFADFTVAVNVPKNFAVWSTGDLQNPDEVLQPTYAQRLKDSMTSDQVLTIAQPNEMQQGLVTAQSDTVTWKWKADNVPDFALGLSDHYIWDAGSVVVDPATGRRAGVQSAYPVEATSFKTMVEDGKAALAFGSTDWPGVPYPYSKTSIFVGGADEEYPMMANDSPEAPEGGTVRFVAAHELLHSWFPFYMGTDERRYGFMDEGWTTANEYLFNVKDLGASQAAGFFKQFRSDGLANYLAGYGVDIPIITPSDSLRGVIVGHNNYEKAALGYLALKDLMGDEAFKSALHEFMARWNGKHPLPWDMFNSFNNASGQNYNWFFNEWFFQPHYLDLAISGVEQSSGGYSVQVNNIGGMPVPFDAIITYTDATSDTLHQTPVVWQADLQATTIQINTTKEVQSVILDGGIFVDMTPKDNEWKGAVKP